MSPQIDTDVSPDLREFAGDVLSPLDDEFLDLGYEAAQPGLQALVADEVRAL